MSARGVVVTGAGGFIGRHVCLSFAAEGRSVDAWARRAGPGAASPRIAWRMQGDLASIEEAALARDLEGVKAIVHLAARAHVPALARDAAEAALHHDNVEATSRLARAARSAGVPRFILVSSVKVNGESTPPGRPFRPGDPPAPRDAYGRSKRAAERVLRETLSGSDTAAIVLRLPLVYGAGAPGNFRALVDAVRAGRLLPLGAIDNRRHLAGIANVTGALAAVLDATMPPAGVHFVADADSVSTPGLVRAIGLAMGVPARLIRVPVPLLRAAGALTGRRGAIERLTGSLEVDTTSLREAIGWHSEPFAISPAMLD
jgi:UDP-glucose 4-epimerase